MDLYDEISKPKSKEMSPIIFPDMEIKTLPITPNAYEKMHKYREIYDSLTGTTLEFFGFLLRKTDSGVYSCRDINNHVIRNIVLGRNQENTYAHTYLDATDVQETLAGLDKKVWQLAGWTHRHPDGVFSRSGEDARHNLTMISSIQASNYLQDYMTVPMDHLEMDFKQSPNGKGTDIWFFDKRDGAIYTMHSNAETKDAIMSQFKDKKLPVRLSYAHSMIIRRDRSLPGVFSEVITRRYAGNSLDFIEKNGMSDGLKTKIEIIEVPDDIVLDIKKMEQEVRDCTYIPKIHDSGIHISKGYAFGEKITELAEKTGGGYFFIKKKKPMSRMEFKDMFGPFLRKRLEPEEYAKWERRALTEIPLIPKPEPKPKPNVLEKDISVADKVLEGAGKDNASIDGKVDPAKPTTATNDAEKAENDLEAMEKMNHKKESWISRVFRYVFGPEQSGQSDYKYDDKDKKYDIKKEDIKRK